jgi:hypothetical protein
MEKDETPSGSGADDRTLQKRAPDGTQPPVGASRGCGECAAECRVDEFWKAAGSFFALINPAAVWDQPHVSSQSSSVRWFPSEIAPILRYLKNDQTPAGAAVFIARRLKRLFQDRLATFRNYPHRAVNGFLALKVSKNQERSRKAGCGMPDAGCERTAHPV